MGYIFNKVQGDFCQKSCGCYCFSGLVRGRDSDYIGMNSLAHFSKVNKT